jgi:hypothetical protein
VLPENVAAESVDRLAAALDGLSEAMWETYVHPASQFGDPEEPNTQAWRWGLERDAFDKALAAVHEPYLSQNGMLVVSYCRVEESGNRIGRAVHDLDLGEDFKALITAEVEREQAAVEAAEMGDLADRAAQAMVLSRIGASPTQVEMAWQALLANPLSCGDVLLTRFEPSAAAIAAARCLRCAAEITAEVAGIDSTEVVIEADDIEALPVMTPTTVLAMLAEGASEREAVTALLLQAHAVADGELSGVEHLASVIQQVQRVMNAEISDEGLDFRLTPLDPRRPAPDMLEDLLTAIHGCFLLWQEYADDLEDAQDRDDESDGSDEDGLNRYDENADTGDEAEDEAEDEAWREDLARRFEEDLRLVMEMAGSPT